MSGVVTEYEDAWVADLAIHWVANSEVTLLELKLSAPYTALQKKVKDKMIVVAPRYTRSDEGLADLITLEEMIEEAKLDADDESLKAACFLLGEACERHGWYVEELSVETLVREARSIFDEEGPQRNWGELYRFLNQIDLHLRDGAYLKGARYDSDARMRPATRSRYYGYCLGMTTAERGRIARPWWIGLEFSTHGVPSFRLYHSNEEVCDYLAARPTRLRASEVAADIVTRALS